VLAVLSRVSRGAEAARTLWHLREPPRGSRLRLSLDCQHDERPHGHAGFHSAARRALWETHRAAYAQIREVGCRMTDLEKQ
jgi:hypothetical protein